MIDSRIATYEHIDAVRMLIGAAIRALMLRQVMHDRTKLASPEVEVFDEYTPKLAGCTYGSDEYRGFLKAMKPALEHHYMYNRHHPEFHVSSKPDAWHELVDGTAIRRMNLIDLMEMLCDWLAATKRHNDGDIRKSIEINQKRFGYSDELKQILVNTLNVIAETGTP